MRILLSTILLTVTIASSAQAKSVTERGRESVKQVRLEEDREIDWKGLDRKMDRISEEVSLKFSLASCQEKTSQVFYSWSCEYYIKKAMDAGTKYLKIISYLVFSKNGIHKMSDREQQEFAEKIAPDVNSLIDEVKEMYSVDAIAKLINLETQRIARLSL